MHNKSVIIAATCLTFGLFSQAIGSETQIATRTAAVETTVKTDFDATWNELVSELGGRDYEINALVPQDRTIRVLVRSQIPSEYVDCGEISVRSKHAVFGDRNYNFLAANSVRYLVVDERADELVDVERRTSLNALANVQLTATDQGTVVRVDALYVMKFRTREFGNNVATRKVDETLNFDSAGQATTTEDIRQGATSKSVTVACRATGALERKIVSVLGNSS
jgi:hypothetical protein